MTDAEKIKKLEERLALYETNPIADLYLSLAKAIRFLKEKLDDQSLNLETDIFQISVFAMAKDIDKLSSSMEKGKQVFEISDSVNPSQKKLPKNAKEQISKQVILMRP